MPSSPQQKYHALLRGKTIRPDPEQESVVAALELLWRALNAPRHGGLWGRLQGLRPASVRGLYLWGGVGRGKTWLMDLFFEALPAGGKQRIHFHRFMARVHAALREHGSQRNPLRRVAREWAARCRVLCFDELHVADIADAMLLGGLLEALFQSGVVLVATSNLHPDELYRDGLQRARFLPAIDQIRRHCQVMELGGETDYRLRILERTEIYHCPLDEEAERNLKRGFERISGGLDIRAALEVNGRTLTARRRGDGVIWFDFDELCHKPRGASDYIELSRSFNTVLLSGVPVMDESSPDRARRFIHLVDEFYDRNVKLLVSAAAAPAEIYTGSRLAAEFRRTASRLVEMQSRAYLARPHLP